MSDLMPPREPDLKLTLDVFNLGGNLAAVQLSYGGVEITREQVISILRTAIQQLQTNMEDV